MATLGQNATMAERVRYNLAEVSPQDIASELDELEAWRDVAANSHIYSPDELEAFIEDSEGKEFTFAEFVEVCRERDDAQEEADALWAEKAELLAALDNIINAAIENEAFWKSTEAADCALRAAIGHARGTITKARGQ